MRVHSYLSGEYIRITSYNESFKRALEPHITMNLSLSTRKDRVNYSIRRKIMCQYHRNLQQNPFGYASTWY